MFSKVYSSAVHGIDGQLITVEVDIRPGLPALSIVGLPDTSVKEARDRVVSAIRNSGFEIKPKKITVNLAPAHIKKEGPSFELPIAVSILAAAKKIQSGMLSEYCFLGELALDGSLRPVRGVLSIVMALSAKGYTKVILPDANRYEAAIVPGVEIYPVQSLREVAGFLNGEITITPYQIPASDAEEQCVTQEIDFSEVKGQQFAKRALEVAAAGGHNVLLMGPPGAGKTMLARCLPGILPELSFEEALETTRIFSVAGLLEDGQAIMRTRPFRNPHHTISDIALIGGGTHSKPGEISLSHNGILFLDELPEFHRNVLEVMRQPLEEGRVNISRAAARYTYPARFMLIAAMNPCPCGFYGHPEKECMCTPYAIHKYRGRISGPLLDRIDMHIEVPALNVIEITRGKGSGDSNEIIRRRVTRARAIQYERLCTKSSPRKKNVFYTNAQIPARQIKTYCAIDRESNDLLEQAIRRLGFSARAYDRILKVSRTIADLEQSEKITPAHVAEAIQYRMLDKSVSG